MISKTYSQKKNCEVVVYDSHLLPIDSIGIEIINGKDSYVKKTKKGKISIEFIKNDTICLRINNPKFSFYEECFIPSYHPKEIFLKSTFHLNELAVKGRNQNISRSFGVVTLKVDDDSPLFHNASFLDIIKLIPEIVEDRGKIKILGKSRTLYLVNGRESIRKADSFQSNEIDRIEVISNPSSKYQGKYDSVINILTKKHKNNGSYFNGNSDVFIGNSISHGSGINTGKNLRKISINSQLQYYLDRGRVEDWGNQEYSNKIEDYKTALESQKNSSRASMNINYSINDSQNVGLDFNYNRVPKQHSKYSTKSYFKYLKEIKKEELNSISETAADISSINLGFYHNLFKKNKEWSSFFSFFENSQYSQNEISSIIDNDKHNKITSNNYNKSYIISTDYTHKTSSASKIESGARISLFDGSYAIHSQQISQPEKKTLFDFNENLYSTYLSYLFSLKRWEFSTSLRYEYFHRRVKFNQTNDLETKEDNWLPSVSAMYRSANKKHNIEFSYAKKLDRPNFNDITPFEYNLRYNTKFKGNPNLKNEFIHSYQLKYAYANKLFLLPYYNHYQNYIEQISIFKNNELIWIPENYNSTNIGLTMMYNFKLFNKLILYNKINTEYIKNNGHISNVSLNRSLWQFQIFLSQYFSFNDRTSISVLTTYMSPQLSDFYEINQGLRVDLKFNTKIFKRKINASIKFNDLFNTYYNEISGNYNGFSSYRYSDFSTRNIIFSLSYHFQSGKKVTSPTINIDTSKEEERLIK